MQLTHEFEVSVPPDQLWELLTDIEGISSALPGFKLTGVEADSYAGTMKVKVGAVTVSYDATMRFIERDDAARRAVIEGDGREPRGQGRASATITSSVEPTDSGSKATVVTDFTVTGRVAQFGGGVMTDVSNRLVAQFVKNLEQQIATPPAASEPLAGDPPGSSEPSEASVRTSGAAMDTAPVNLMSVAAVPVLKRTLPFALLTAALIVVWRRLR